MSDSAVCTEVELTGTIAFIWFKMHLHTSRFHKCTANNSYVQHSMFKFEQTVVRMNIIIGNMYFTDSTNAVMPTY